VLPVWLCSNVSHVNSLFKLVEFYHSKYVQGMRTPRALKDKLMRFLERTLIVTTVDVGEVLKLAHELHFDEHPAIELALEEIKAKAIKR
jgi:DNA polymerase III alpha subunit (gram-positive type)